MYHPDIVERRLHTVQKQLTFPLKRYEIGDSIDRQEHLVKLWEPEKGKTRRELKQAEKQFILNEITLSTWDFDYWMRRYGWVLTPTGAKVRFKPWESQEIAMEHIARGELRAWERMSDNLFDVLKSRQMGLSQLFQKLICHRLVFFENQRGMIASYEPGPTHKLFRRLEMVYDALPWYMKPEPKFWKKADEPCEAVYFKGLNSSLYVGHGRKKGGGIGQGDSTNVFHFSELPDWENWEQVEEDFLPSVALHPTSFGARESTPRGRGDHWHAWFTASWAGKSRFQAMFIPCYVEKTRYQLNPPLDWKPNKVTLEYAHRVEKQSPIYCFGKTIRPEPDHLYWYEQTYNEYKGKGQLSTFLSEYATDHESCFVHRTVGMFSAELMMQLRNRLPDFDLLDIASA